MILVCCPLILIDIILTFFLGNILISCDSSLKPGDVPHHIPWANFKDFAYSKQITLCNWFEGGTFPGGEGFAKNSLRGMRATEVVASWKRALEDPSEVILELVSWSDGTPF